jgi:hypothetical protein
MIFSTLMVHLDLEPSNDARLQIAGELAEQFNANARLKSHAGEAAKATGAASCAYGIARS